MLRTKLEMALKDCSAVRREKQSIEHENEFLRTELERMAQQQQDDDGQSERKVSLSFIQPHQPEESPRFYSSCNISIKLIIRNTNVLYIDWERQK